MSEPKDSNPELVSKVTFSPVSDGKTDALIVTIKKVAPEGEDFFRVMETPKRSMSLDSNKKSRTKSRASSKSSTKSTMTEPAPSSPAETVNVSNISLVKSLDERIIPDDSPCMKHAAENISRKATSVPQSKVSLCSDCSKSMLSYIFLVQDFLDGLAKEIIGDSSSQKCLQCLKQENRTEVSMSEPSTSSHQPIYSTPKESFKHERVVKTSKDDRKSRRSQQKLDPASSDVRRETRKYEESSEQQIQRTLTHHQEERSRQSLKQPVLQQHPSDSEKVSNRDTHNYQQQQPIDTRRGVPNETFNVIPDTRHGSEYTSSMQPPSSESPGLPSSDRPGPPSSDRPGSPSSDRPPHSGPMDTPMSLVDENEVAEELPQRFIKPLTRMQPDLSKSTSDEDTQDTRMQIHRLQEPEAGSSTAERPAYSGSEGVTSPISEGVDGIMTTLSNIDREVYDSARNVAGWDSLAEPQERLVSLAQNRIPSEAFVTMCRNNAEAIGCLVLGASLLLCRTTRTLCVLVSDGVSNAFRDPLSSVFHVVQTTRSLDSLGTTKLALLEQPELGISFEKLNVWRFDQFSKCVYLNPDTLVLKNCDELFSHDELSAVPDIGWPDCFNSGVFVFVPSQQTFWNLLEFAEKQGSYDGGDQGLLNSYFNSWSDDIGKKLSFIYNLMANVSYTYTPAFKQFGRNVKIVQFHGSFKPWHVKFFSRTGQIAPASTVHPTYVQFVHVWLNIFRISALRQLSREIQKYARSQEVICAVELLRFFPLPLESEAEFFLTPPSVRLRLAERKLQKTSKGLSEAQRRKSAEFSHKSNEDEADIKDISQQEATPEATQESGKDPESILPGSEVGNYQGMKAWEQGRMDYQGTDSSEVILNRLKFLMDHPA